MALDNILDAKPFGSSNSVHPIQFTFSTFTKILFLITLISPPMTNRQTQVKSMGICLRAETLTSSLRILMLFGIIFRRTQPQ